MGLVLTHTASLIWRHIQMGWHLTLVYNLRIFFDLLGSLIFFALQVLIWSYLTHDKTIAGYDEPMMVGYFSYMYLVSLVLSPGCDVYLSRRIISGNISLDLLKPAQALVYLPFEKFGPALYRLLILGLPVLVLTRFFYPVPISLNRAITIIPLLLASYIFLSALDYLLASLCFYTKAFWGIYSLKVTIFMLLTGRLLPLEFYPAWFARILDMNPLALAFFHTVKYLTGSPLAAPLPYLCYLQTVYAMLALLSAWAFWKMGMRRLSIQGG